mgnify:CR=1 FL=1
MCLGDFAPNNSESGVSGCVLGLVDEGNSLSKVEGSVFLVVDTLDLQQCELFVLDALASLEASEDSLSVESKNEIKKRKIST